MRQYASAAATGPPMGERASVQFLSFVNVPVGGYRYNVRQRASTNLIATDMTALGRTAGLGRWARTTPGHDAGGFRGHAGGVSAV